MEVLLAFRLGEAARDAGFCHVDQLTEILRYANAVGALTSLMQGVIPALPTAQQVEQFLAERS